MTQPEDRSTDRTESADIDEFIKDLEHTAQQVQELLKEIRDSKVDAATIKAELKYLVENVRELSAIIRTGGESGSVLTRLALLEQSVKDLKKYVSKDTDAGSETNIRIALLEQKVDILISKKDIITKKKPDDPEGKWKLYIAIASGIFTLLGSIAAALLQYFAE
jgi:flagellar biosynthesis component FlhA